MPGPAPTSEEMESLGPKSLHFEPKCMGDRFVEVLVNTLFATMNVVFPTKGRTGHFKHAVCLETVAAIPGLLAVQNRTYQALRTIRGDANWVSSLFEERENEYVHMNIIKAALPSLGSEIRITAFDKAKIMAVHFGSRFLMGTLYKISPRLEHRFVGYVEEKAVVTYSAFLADIDAGKVPNFPAPRLGKMYYHLPEDATMRDVILRIRGDEWMHSFYNHFLADQII